uniref:IncF plasmid conjugative transfer protein TraN n=1 Tax=Klebsiella pneumoniae TaxID=573 RepID=A0A8B0SZ13_KLEPN|nr:IncF plasmid conjugative transfer protein TraN [Klebsiella pneumoniae]
MAAPAVLTVGALPSRNSGGLIFNKLDFTNFMDDLMKKIKKIPENDVLTNKTRERIKEIMSQQSAQ